MDLRDLVKLAGIVNPELLNRIEPTAEVEEADGAGFEDATTRPEEEVMDDPMATYGSDVDLSLRRYLKAKGDHVTVDEEIYPDHTVESVTEAYAEFKEGKYSKKKKYGEDLDEDAVKEATCGCGPDCGHCGGKHTMNEVGKKCSCCDNEVKAVTAEGRMKDSVIHDSETMTKSEFAKKHGKEMADEYYESVTEGHMKDKMIDDAEKMSKSAFIKKYGEENAGTWESVNESLEEAKMPDQSLDMLKKLAGL